MSKSRDRQARIFEQAIAERRADAQKKKALEWTKADVNSLVLAARKIKLGYEGKDGLVFVYGLADLHEALKPFAD